MSAQRSDDRVIHDAAVFNATYRKLKAELRSQGIRSLKSPRAREAIDRASTRPKAAIRREG